MKAIIVALGSLGDVLPSIALAKELAKINFEVEVITYPPFKERVQSAGIVSRCIGTSDQYSKMVSAQAGLSNAEYCFHHVATCHQHSIAPLFNYLSQYSRSSDCVVIAQAWCTGAVWACDNYDIPLLILSVMSHDLFLGSHVDIPPPDWIEIQSLKTFYGDGSREAEVIDQVRVSMGLKVTNTIVHEMSMGTICVYPRVIINALFNGGWPIQQDRQVYFIERDNLFSSARQPCVEYGYDFVFTCGSAFAPTQREFNAFKKLCDVFNKKGVFISQNPSDIRESSRNIDVVKHICMPSALSGASLIIHHGGIGTTSDAISFGVPQVVIPRAFDQLLNARVVQHYGLGISINLEEFCDYESMIKKIQTLLDCRAAITSIATNITDRGSNALSVAEVFSSPAFDMLRAAGDTIISTS